MKGRVKRRDKTIKDWEEWFAQGESNVGSDEDGDNDEEDSGDDSGSDESTKGAQAAKPSASSSAVPPISAPSGLSTETVEVVS